MLRSGLLQMTPGITRAMARRVSVSPRTNVDSKGAGAVRKL